MINQYISKNGQTSELLLSTQSAPERQKALHFCDTFYICYSRHSRPLCPGYLGYGGEAFE